MAAKQADLTGDNRRTRRPRKPAWKPIFLAELEKWGVVDHAIRQAGVTSSTAYEARETDEKFAAAWDEAEGRLLATAEVVARQRALTGTPRPVYFQGQKVDTVMELDNVHLRWLLSKLKPSVYGDKLALTDNEGGPLKVEVYLPDNRRGDGPPVVSVNGHTRPVAVPAAEGSEDPE